MSFSPPQYFTVKGKIVSGLGEGAKYIKLYREQIRKTLGIDPYPGTLNIDVEQDMSKVLPLDKAIIIPPPRAGYGIVYAFKALLAKTEEVYVLKPAITTHSWRILEVISSYNLRRKLGLRDGVIVELTIMV